MIKWNYIFTLRSKGLIDQLKYEELQILGEICKQYIISPDGNELTLQGNFSKYSVSHVLNQLGVKDSEFHIIVFPNSKTTTIKFN